MPGYGGNPGWSFEYMQSDVLIIVVRAQLGVCRCICQGENQMFLRAYIQKLVELAHKIFAEATQPKTPPQYV